MTSSGQMTFTDIALGRFFDRHGRLEECPEWVKDERCGNCAYWQILPEYDQPPCGWGVRGLCGSHQCQNQYTTSQTSYCQEWRAADIWNS